MHPISFPSFPLTPFLFEPFTSVPGALNDGERAERPLSPMTLASR
jgi:hypothetical protein